jgi:hypothetical protein
VKIHLGWKLHLTGRVAFLTSNREDLFWHAWFFKFVYELIGSSSDCGIKDRSSVIVFAVTKIVNS